MNFRGAREYPVRHLPGRLRHHGAQNEDGIVLVIVLLITVLLATLVIEFAYSVFLATSSLNNWQDSKRLGIAAASSITHLNKWLVSPEAAQFRSKPSIEMEIPLKKDGCKGRERFDRITVCMEDESAKFNLNTLVYAQNGLRNDEACKIFARLLSNLNLDTNLAGTIVDWMDRDEVSESLKGETGAKNEPFVTPDELLLIPGIDKEVYARLRRFVTIWGNQLADINLNTAPREVIMSLGENITPETADRIVAYRENQPLKPQDIDQIAPDAKWDTSFGSPSTVGTAYFIRLTGECDGIKRIIETAEVAGSGNTMVTKYWKEY
ncbi:MAG: type II secretion system minor pseudopilin GspK [Pseudomonadota bacterium]